MKRTLLPPLIEDIVNFFKNTQFHSLNCLSEPEWVEYHQKRRSRELAMAQTFLPPAEARRSRSRQAWLSQNWELDQPWELDQVPELQIGPRGGNFYLRTRADGTTYRQYT